ncbi:hypothetical protein Tco_1450804 [Tanacetum coccineum]
MSPPARASHAKFHWGIAFATGLKRFTGPVTKLRMKHTKGRVRIPKGYHSSEEEVEENERLKEVWEKMEYVISDSDSDLESTASS